MRRKLMIMFSFLACLLVGCANNENNKGKNIEKENEVEDTRKTAENKSTIVWKVSAETNIFSHNVELLNQELENRGYDFAVEFQKMETEYGGDYEKEVKEELAEGRVDIINVGSESSGNCTGIDQIFRAGYLASWNEYFQTDEGQKLYELYSESTWKTLAVDGETYSIPNENMMYGDSWVAFNSDYISKETAESWNGELESLYQIVENAKLDDSVIPIYMGYDAENLFIETGNYIHNGILIDTAKKKAKNPYEDKAFLNLMYDIKDGYDKALFQSNFSLSDTSEYDEEVEKKVENKQYAVYYGASKEKDERFVYVRLPFMQVSSLSLSVGVCEKSEVKEEAFQLLYLLRTDDELANLLIWGEESKDYTKTDGIATRTDGSSVMMQKFMTGLCDGVYSDIENVYTDRRQYKAELQKTSKNITNPLLGFQVNTKGLRKELNNSYMIFIRNLDCFKEADFEEKLPKIAAEWKKENGKLQKKLQKQLDHYKS